MSRRVKYALIAVAIFILTLVGEQLSRRFHYPLGEHSYAFFFLLLPFIVFLALREIRKKDYSGQLTFGKAFRSAILICAIVSVLVGLSYLVYMLAFEQDRAAEILRRTMENNERAGMSQEQLDAARRSLELTTNPFIGAMIMSFGTLLYGVFLSLACSGLMRVGSVKSETGSSRDAAA